MAGDVKVAVVSGAIASGGTGTADFTKAGFGTPKACIVLVSWDAADDTSVAAESRMSIGFSDLASEDFSIMHQDEDASAKVDCDARKNSLECYGILTVAGAITISGVASAITDGIRLTNGANVGGDQPFATVIMFGGADLAISLQSTGINSSEDGTADITHSGFTDGNDKLLFFIGTDISGENSSSTGINNSFGVCHIAGSDGGGWSFVQRCMGWASDHNATEGAPSSIISTDRVLDIITEAGTQDWGLEVTAFSNSSGTITVTTRDNGSGAGMEVYSLALDLDDRSAKVGSVDGPVSGATWIPSVSLGFTPQYVGLGLSYLRTEDTINSAQFGESFGISSNTGGGEETCHQWLNVDGAPTTTTFNTFRSRAIYFLNRVENVEQDHSHSSFNSGGWTYTINAEDETIPSKWFYWTIEAAAAAGAPPIEPAAETDLALALGRLKEQTVALGAETDAALGLSASRALTLGTAAETDSLPAALTWAKARGVGVASEADTALALARLKEQLITLADETDSTFAITHSRQRTVGIALETDTAFAVGRLKALLMTFAAETDAAFVISASRARTAGLATETDTVFVITHTKSKAITLAPETDTIPAALTWSKAKAIALAEETDTALATILALTKVVGIVEETDSASTVTHTKSKAVSIAEETDTVPAALTWSKSKVITLAGETDTAFIIQPRRLVPITLASELSTALALGRLKERLIAVATETDTALAISTGLAVLLGVAPETDSAEPLSRNKARTPGTAPETDSAPVVRPERLTPITLATEADSALVIPHSKALLLGIAAETDLALAITAVGGGGAPVAEGWLIPQLRRRRR